MIYIVGFPRNKEQCDYFEHLIGPSLFWSFSIAPSL